MKQTQIEKVKYQLETNGKVTRNWALQNYISRLGALILMLKNQGYAIKGQNKDGDYEYTLINTPHNTQNRPLKHQIEVIKEYDERGNIKRVYERIKPQTLL